MRKNCLSMKKKLIEITEDFVKVGSEKISKDLWKKYYANNKEIYNRVSDFEFIRHIYGTYKENGKTKTKYKDFWVNNKTGIKYQTFANLLKGIKITEMSNSVYDLVKIGDKVQYLDSDAIYPINSQYQVGYIREHGFKKVMRLDPVKNIWRTILTYDKENGVSTL